MKIGTKGKYIIEQSNHDFTFTKRHSSDDFDEAKKFMFDCLKAGTKAGIYEKISGKIGNPDINMFTKDEMKLMHCLYNKILTKEKQND